MTDTLKAVAGEECPVCGKRDHEAFRDTDGMDSVRLVSHIPCVAKLVAAVEEQSKALGTVREVAERITQEGTDAPLDPLWLYERMCEVIEVIDAARPPVADERCGTCGWEWCNTCMYEPLGDRTAYPDQTCRYATSQWKPKSIPPTSPREGKDE